MATGVTWTGLGEFKAQLKDMPAHLAEKGGDIAIRRAEAAAAEIKAAYPTGPQGSPRSNSGNPPGGLKRGVKVKVIREAGSVVAEVRSSAPHAHLFEWGTQNGDRSNDQGANRGPMPPAKVFVPIVVRHRAAMYREQADMLREAGLTVTGDV